MGRVEGETFEGPRTNTPARHGCRRGLDDILESFESRFGVRLADAEHESAHGRADMAESIVKQSQRAPVAVEQAPDETQGIGHPSADDLLPQRHRVSSPWHEHPTVRDAQAAAVHGEHGRALFVVQV